MGCTNVRNCKLDLINLERTCGSLFFKQEMELSLIGLQNAGKTSLVNVIAASYSLTFVSFMQSRLRGKSTMHMWCFAKVSSVYVIFAFVEQRTMLLCYSVT